MKTLEHLAQDLVEALESELGDKCSGDSGLNWENLPFQEYGNRINAIGVDILPEALDKDWIKHFAPRLAALVPAAFKFASLYVPRGIPACEATSASAKLKIRACKVPAGESVSDTGEAGIRIEKMGAVRDGLGSRPQELRPEFYRFDLAFITEAA